MRLHSDTIIRTAELAFGLAQLFAAVPLLLLLPPVVFACQLGRRERENDVVSLWTIPSSPSSRLQEVNRGGMALLAEHALLYALRSPTTPLADKVASASSALDAQPGNVSLAATVRDWAVDALLRATRQQASVAGTAAILDADLWELAARTTEATLSTSPVAASTLPIFVAFVTQYSQAASDVQLLRSAASVWSRLAANALRKATADASLDAYEKLLEASLRVFSREEGAGTVDEREVWTELAVNWLKPFRSVALEAGKGGKKIPSHTLSLLPTLLPLLSRLSPTSPLRTSLLQTLQLAIFNLENLRRGLARDSYTAGGASTSSQPAPSTADSELLAALASLPSTGTAAAYDAIPSLTQIYFSAVATHAETLFPLPAKATFATPSAQKSAREVLGLTKRREMAGRWIRGVIDYLSWPKEANAMETDEVGLEEVKSAALAGSLAVVEQNDLHRPGQAGESWDKVLPDIVSGAVSRLEGSVNSANREATFTILRTISNLDHDVLEPALPRILAVLAGTPDLSTLPTPELDAFLRHLIEHHSRSVTLPTLLTRIADALASAASSTSNDSVLTSHTFLSQLGTAVAGIVGGPNAVRAAWQTLVDPVLDALQPSATTEAADATDAPSPAKKRKLSSAPPSSVLPAASRLRVADVLIRHAPVSSLSVLVEPLRVFVDEVIDSHLKDFAKASLASSAAEEVDEESETPRKKAKKSSRRKSGAALAVDAGQVDPATRLGVELFQLLYTAVSRLSSEGLLSMAEGAEETSRWWELRAKRRELLREVVEKGVPEAAVVSTKVLLQQLELRTDLDDAEAAGIVQAVLSRVEDQAASEETSWSGRLRGLRAAEAGIATWELLSRRWLPLINNVASEDQLRQVASITLSSLRRTSPAGSEWSLSAITARLLRRADFWELPRVQACLLPALRDLVSLPSLSSPTAVLAAMATPTDKASKALRSLAQATLLETVDVFAAISTCIPVEYLNKETRRQLADCALALDLWVTSGEVAVLVEAKERAQHVLRSFVASLGVQANISSDVTQRLLHATLPAALDETLVFYRTLVVEPALATLKQNQHSGELQSILDSFGGLSVGATTSAAGPREEAFFALLDSLVTAIPDATTLPAELRNSIVRLVDQAKRQLDESLPAASSVFGQKSATSLAGLLVAYRSLWAAQHWLRNGEERTEIATEFVHAAAASVVSLAASASAERPPLRIVTATLRLLALHAEVLRSSASPGKVDTRPFEMLLACHLVLRQTVDDADAADLDAECAAATASTTVEEYSAALQAVAEALATDAGPSFEHTMQVAKILLLAGPEGSSRVAASSLSDILRQLLLLVERKTVDGSGSLELFLPVASFVESICGERPLLLSRLNTSSVLSLASLILRPSPKSPSTGERSSPASTVSEVFLTLATSVGDIVRHRKDHLVTLFPSLISVLSAFLSTLRRAGAGTLGSVLEGEDETASVVVGHRAEREAKATFPAWIWEGGRDAIGRNEARAVGRLLGSLTAKTTTTTASKRKSAISTGQAVDASANTSLAAPLSKHAPFLLLDYLRACVHPTCPIPSALRAELQGGWSEILDAMGKWEREALMKGLLSEDEEAERGVLRNLWKSWEKERYKASLRWRQEHLTRLWLSFPPTGACDRPRTLPDHSRLLVRSFAPQLAHLLHSRLAIACSRRPSTPLDNAAPAFTLRMSASWLSDDTRDVLLCCFAPPVIVKRKRGVHLDFWLHFHSSLELTLFGSNCSPRYAPSIVTLTSTMRRWLPGVMFAIYILFADEDPPPRRANTTSQDDTRLAQSEEDGQDDAAIRKKRRRDRWKRSGRRRESSELYTLEKEATTRQFLLDDPFALDCSLSLAMASSEKAPLNPQEREDPVLPTALRLPVFNKLKGKHIVLASASPRRNEILRTFGLNPRIVPSTFPETLSHAEFDDPAQYAVATGSAKAVEVYQQLVRDDPEDPPDLVIGGKQKEGLERNLLAEIVSLAADTVVILPGPDPTILEKPRNKADQLNMLESYQGAKVQVVTGVTIVQPQIATPGYSCASLVVATNVVFADCSSELLQAYVECGEGLDRAGGFAVQGQGGLLVKRVEGDYNNVVGFPGQAFIEWLSQLTEEGTLLELD
ncbi:N-acetylserotonin O-methyltransferase-like protein [Rhodotorula toruloides]|nr:N-acetylserotonin O-methyltransferase-like protein [Rhodotorula toruloides]